MAYRCPYCGAAIDDKDRCNFCNSELGWIQKIYEKSNRYYTKGYNEANNRNLTTAAAYLEKSIYFNKYNITARNLLGLIYYEMGKIGSALKEWIISSSLDKDNNLAQEYISNVQDSPKLLVTYKDSITLYNKALIYLKQGNDDMAVIRLKKAVGLNPKLLEAKNLLVLCYIKEKQFYKANEQIKGVLAIDQSNLKALTYFRELSKEDTNTIQPYEIEYIPRQSKNSSIKPSRVINRGNVFATYIMYFVIGALCMLVVEFSLILPNKTKDYQSQIAKLKDAEISLTDTLEDFKKKSETQITELEVQNKKLDEQKQEALLVNSKMAQKEKVSEAAKLKSSGEWIKAAELLYNVAPALLENEVIASYNELKKEVYPKASTFLCNEGYNYMNREEFVEAKSRLEKAILYEPTDYTLRKSLYYLGLAEKGDGNNEKAKYYFTKVTSEYQGTNEAYWSNKELKNIK